MATKDLVRLQISLPLPSSYIQGDSFVGIRPFYNQGNITRRSPLISSNQHVWYFHSLYITPRSSTLIGNYANYQQLYTIHDEIASTNPTKRTVLHFCLLPTQFCLTPHTVSYQGLSYLISSYRNSHHCFI